MAVLPETAWGGVRVSSGAAAVSSRNGGTDDMELADDGGLPLNSESGAAGVSAVSRGGVLAERAMLGGEGGDEREGERGSTQQLLPASPRDDASHLVSTPGTCHTAP